MKLPSKMSDAKDREKEPAIADHVQAIAATRNTIGAGGGGGQCLVKTHFVSRYTDHRLL